MSVFKRLLESSIEIISRAKTTRGALAIAMVPAALMSISAAPADSAMLNDSAAAAEAPDQTAAFTKTMRTAMHIRTPDAIKAAQTILGLTPDGQYANLPIERIGTAALNKGGVELLNAVNNPMLTNEEFLELRAAALPYRKNYDRAGFDVVKAYQTAIGLKGNAVDGKWGNGTDRAEVAARQLRTEALARLTKPHPGNMLIIGAAQQPTPAAAPMNWETASQLLVQRPAAQPVSAAPAMGRLAGRDAFIRVGNGRHGISSDMKMRSAHRSHFGVDIGAPLGTPQFSLFDEATVLYAGLINGGGKTIILSSPIGVTMRLMHFDTLNVKAGDVLTRGQQIGTTGRSNASGNRFMRYGYRDPHYHGEVFLNNGHTLVNVDPDLAAAAYADGQDLRNPSVVRELMDRTRRDTGVTRLTAEAGDITSRTGRSHIQLASYMGFEGGDAPRMRPAVVQVAAVQPQQQLPTCPVIMAQSPMPAAPIFQNGRYNLSATQGFRSAAIRNVSVSYDNGPRMAIMRNGQPCMVATRVSTPRSPGL